jgi:hydroxymethylglutaryl-CoA lyase
MMMASDKLHVVDVALRDGLQNLAISVPLEERLRLWRELRKAGVDHIEAGAFVRPDKVPSMAVTTDLARHLGVDARNTWFLVPNERGLRDALAAGCRSLALFSALSSTFNQKNRGQIPTEQVEHDIQWLQQLASEGWKFVNRWEPNLPAGDRYIRIRYYVSTVIACPYEGAMSPDSLFRFLEKLENLPLAQVSLGDTLGVGTVVDWQQRLPLLGSWMADNRLALHCHDSYNTALNCLAYGYEAGIRTVDSSLFGWGGCPFAPGAKGNVATESVVEFFMQQGVSTGIDLDILRNIQKP